MSPNTRRSPAPSAGPASTTSDHHEASDVTVADAADEWQDRLAELTAETRRKRELRQQVRAQFAIARAAGLRARHAAKLRRSG